MNFSKTDESFGRASIDELARNALLQNLKKSRRILIWVFWANVTFLLATAILCFWQLAPILYGNFESSNPSLSNHPGFVFGAIGFSTLLGLLTVFGLVAADLRVKMLIIIGSHDQRMPDKTQSEQVGSSNGG